MEKSIRGKWNDVDKTTFLDKFRRELKESAKIDANLKVLNVTDTQIDIVSTCSLAKIEAIYTPEEADYSENQTTIEQFNFECMMSILMGEKGTWSVKFREIIKIQMIKKLEDSLTTEQKNSLVDCIISKAEKELDPREVPENIDKMKEISNNCREEIIGR